ncbi:uncharacterized protein KZ484_015912 [Pholidichthys leucotaenia]
MIDYWSEAELHGLDCLEDTFIWIQGQYSAEAVRAAQDTTAEVLEECPDLLFFPESANILHAIFALRGEESGRQSPALEQPPTLKRHTHRMKPSSSHSSPAPAPPLSPELGAVQPRGSLEERSLAILADIDRLMEEEQKLQSEDGPASSTDGWEKHRLALLADTDLRLEEENSVATRSSPAPIWEASRQLMEESSPTTAVARSVTSPATAGDTISQENSTEAELSGSGGVRGLGGSFPRSNGEPDPSRHAGGVTSVGYNGWDY